MTSNDILERSKLQAPIDAAKAEFFARGGKAKMIDTYRFVPAPVRREWVDPETVLVRKPKKLSRAERNQLKRMAEGL